MTKTYYLEVRPGPKIEKTPSAVPNEASPRKPIGEKAAEIVKLTRSSKDPDAVLTDIAQAKFKGDAQDTKIPKTGEDEAPIFDQASFQKVEKSMTFLVRLAKSLPPNHPQIRSLAQQIYGSESLLQGALAVEGVRPDLSIRLNSLLEASSGIKGMGEFIRNLTVRNAGQLEKGLDVTGDPGQRAAALKLFTNLLHGDTYDASSAFSIRTGLSVLDRHYDAVESGLRGGMDLAGSSQMLKKILEYGGDSLADRAVAAMGEAIRSRNQGIARADSSSVGIVEVDQDLVLYDDLLKLASPQRIERTKPLIAAKIDHLGIDGIAMINAWVESCSPGQLADTVKKNIKAIETLEVEEEGLTKVLNEEYGINDFGRYPSEILINQFKDFIEEQANPSALKSEYGLIVNPRFDKSGAFYQDVELFGSLNEQLNRLGVKLKVVEVDGKLGAVKALNKLRRQSGLISFAVVGGHGTPDSITMGSDQSEGQVAIADMQKKGAGALSLAFIDEPSIIFNSCSTGVQEGIGRAISGVHEGNNIAPDKDTSIDSIDISRNPDSKLVFDVSYHESKSMRYSRGLQQS